jgi:CBS domain-containing protein
MNDLLRIAKRPATSTHSGATVQEACEAMLSAHVGAVVVLDEGRLVGIMSERDVVGRVVVLRRDPSKTLVSEVMTRDVCVGSAGMSAEQAMMLMHTKHFRHLPLVDAAGVVLGVLSVRHLLRCRVEQLGQTNQTLVDYFGADGVGG